MSRETALHRLFACWVLLPAFPLVILTAQTIAGKFGESSGQAWSWFLVQVTPVLAVLSAAAFSNPSPRWRRAQVSPFKWRMALAAAVLQSLAMIAVLLIEPLTGATIFELFDRTSVGLSLLQGLAVAAVSAVVFDGR